MSKILLIVLAFWATTVLSGVFMPAEMKNRIDACAKPEVRESGSAFLKNEQSKILSLLENLKEDNFCLSKLIKDEFSDKKEVSIPRINSLALITSLALSQDFKRHVHTHQLHAVMPDFLKEIKDHFDSSIAALILNQPWYFNDFTPLFLTDKYFFEIESYFYALSHGVVLLGLPNKSYKNVHVGIFESPFELLLHDFAHLVESFGYVKEMPTFIKDFAKQVLLVLNRKNIDQETKIRAFKLLFVLIHEPTFTKALENKNSENAMAMLDFVIDNFRSYFNSYVAPLGSKEDFYLTEIKIISGNKPSIVEISSLPISEDGPKADQPYTQIIWNDGSGRHMSKIFNHSSSYESTKTFRSDYAKIIAKIFPHEKLPPETTTDLDWDPKFVINKYEEAFTWIRSVFAGAQNQ